MSETKTTKLFEVLRQWRNDTAIKQGREPYMVLNNETLKLTAHALPKTKDALTDIKGWGEKKINSYADEIIAIINNGQGKEKITEDKILSVQELLSCLNNLLSTIGIVKVRGEIIEVNQYPNAYCFFTIKDAKTEKHSVGCYVSRWKFDSFSHLIEVGMEVVVSASPSLYKNGKFNLTVDTVEPYGEGALKKDFEVLKKKLEAKGYFDKERKRPLPKIIQNIGLITSEAGAAINDFRKNLGNYGFCVYLKDVLVEGDRAEDSIISAIEWFNKNWQNCDIVVLIRGGGSLESLKAFNSERVANAIITSRLPIIVGIGHEKDITIADFCADKAFSTPTAVSVFIRRQREDLIASVLAYTDAMINTMEQKILHRKENIKYMYERLLSGAQHMLTTYKFLEADFLRSLYQYKTTISEWTHRLNRVIQKGLTMCENRLQAEHKKLEAREAVLISLDPRAILKRGYSITHDTDNTIIKDAKQVHPKQKLLTKLYRGTIISRVDPALFRKGGAEKTEST